MRYKLGDTILTVEHKPFKVYSKEEFKEALAMALDILPFRDSVEYKQILLDTPELVDYYNKGEL